MEQILTVTHRDGTTFNLAHKGSEVWGITAATQNVELNANDTATVDVQSTMPLPFALGDKITVYGKTYTMNELPKVTKNSERKYVYKCTFEGEQYYLLNVNWQMPFSAINDTYTGDLADFATLLVSNLVRLYGNGTWTLGSVPADTETKTLAFTDTNCLDVMQQVCEEWEVEFAIGVSGTAHVLNFYTEIGGTIDYEFMYGRVGGLYELQRNGVNDPDFGTRIYFYGGSNNIPNSYFNSRQSPRLCLAYKAVGVITTNNPTKNNSYLQAPAAVAAYGLIERTKVFEDIYPNRVGTVTAIDANSELVFFDNTMFDLNEKDGQGNTKWLIAGTTAKVHFNTGQLAGYDLDISEFTYKSGNTVIGKFKINALKDENNYVFPSHDNNAFRISVGDEYIITDIVLPSSYITAAQNALQTAAADWYNKHCAPAVEYTMTLSQMFVKDLATEMGITDGVVFHIGDKITVTDMALGFRQKQFRIVQFSRDLTKEYAYTLKISETNLHRAQYRFRRRTYVIPDIIRRFRLDEPAHLAAEANQVAVAYRAFGLGTEGVALGNANSTRIGYIIDNNNHLRPSVVASGTLTQAMFVAELAQRIADIQVLERFINNGSFSNRHFSGTVEFERGKLHMKDFVLHDAYTRAKLGYSVAEWELATETDFDFSNGEYETDKAYHIYADVKEDGTLGYAIIKDGEESSIAESCIKIGTVSADGGNGRTFERSIGEAYMEDGQLKDSKGATRLDIINGLIKDGNGNTLLNLISGYIEGATKIRRNNATTYSLADEIVSARTLRKFFTGSETGAFNFKDANNNDTDIQTILGVSPTADGGMRKIVGDANGGLVKDTSDLKTSVGSINTPNTVMYKINELVASLEAVQTIFDNTYKATINNLINTLNSNSISGTKLISDTQKANLIIGNSGRGECTYNPITKEYSCQVRPDAPSYDELPVPSPLQ